jgi:selenocysteine-specific elongation factor
MSTTEEKKEDDKIVDRSNILNINVGILGHVDSGKTSLVKALSTSLSTAALDKNPQSQVRGITLDLGFSSFTLPMPEHLIEEQKNDINNNDKFECLQFTLVDCPGHASLIRTIIGGAQIIDMMVLVIDANKGIQTQTAECIVIGEITTDKLIIVLNKIDSLPEEDRDNRIEKMTNRIRKIFASTKFANAPIIATAAAVGGEKVASVGAATASEKSIRGGSKSNSGLQKQQTVGVDTLVNLIHSSAKIPKRNTEGSLYFAIDHCFHIKGHGTVLTGTVLNGSLSINSLIEIPDLQIQRKVKSMQMFRKSVKSAKQGDRVGICVTSVDAKTIERGIAATPGSIPLLSNVICMVKKVRFFKGICKTNDRFHVSVGHTTITATALFYGSSELTTLLGLDKSELENKSSPSPVGEIENNTEDEFNLINNNNNSNNNTRTNKSSDSVKVNNKSKNNHLNNLIQNKQSALNATYQNNFPEIDYNYDNDYTHQSELSGGENLCYGKEPVQWVLLQFQQPVFCPIGSLIIGSRLDADSGDNGSQCRLAFYGPVKESIKKDDFDKIKVFHWKEKIGIVIILLFYIHPHKHILFLL